MTDDDTNSTPWSFSEEDHGLLELITKVLWQLRWLARRGHDLIAIGEALQAIECLREGEEVGVNVGLDVGYRRGDRSFEEGLFVCFRINSEEIILDELHSSYSSDVGSDHFTETYATLSPCGGFDNVGVDRWLAAFRSMIAEADAALETSRDHE